MTNDAGEKKHKELDPIDLARMQRGWEPGERATRLQRTRGYTIAIAVVIIVLLLFLLFL